MGDFPKDTKGAMDAMMHDLAIKTGSDWYDLQQPSPTTSTASSKRPGHTRSNSNSSTASSIRSARDSMSSGVTTVTYVDGVPMVQLINEIPPTPEHENGPIVLDSASTASATTTTAPSAQEPIPVFVASQSLPEPAAVATEPIVSATTTGSTPGATTPTTAPASPIVTATNTASSPSPKPALTAPVEQSPFIPHSTYMPTTTYQPGHDLSHSQGTGTPPTRSRPVSADRYPGHPGPGPGPGGFHAPHPLMMQHQQQYPPGPPPPPATHVPMSMPIPVHNSMPRPMQMPVPHIPGSPDPHYPYSNEFGGPGGNKRHSNPISVSFPVRQSSPHANVDSHLPVTTSSATSPSQTPSPRPNQGPRGPQAILPPTEPGFRIPVGAEVDEDGEIYSSSAPGGGGGRRHPQAVEYDGPPPDYAEAAMNPPAEKLDEKKHR